MKKLWTIALLMICITGYTQEGELPREVEYAFQTKYNDARLGDYWVENQMYYFDFTFQGGSYIAVFDRQGTWKETAETISELDIPEALKRYIRVNFPSGNICFCEQVEIPEMQIYLRVTIIDAGNVDRVIRSDLEGTKITILENKS